MSGSHAPGPAPATGTERRAAPALGCGLWARSVDPPRKVSSGSRDAEPSGGCVLAGGPLWRRDPGDSPKLTGATRMAIVKIPPPPRGVCPSWRRGRRLPGASVFAAALGNGHCPPCPDPLSQPSSRRLAHSRFSPRDTSSSSPCFSPDLESDLKVRTSPQGEPAKVFLLEPSPVGTDTIAAGEFSHPGRRSGASHSNLLARSTLGRSSQWESLLWSVFSPATLVRPAHSYDAWPHLSILGRSFRIPGGFSVHPHSPRLLAEGRDDSRLQWQDRLCSVLSHWRKPVGFAGFENH